MDAFLKKNLEPSEQDMFDQLTQMEAPSVSTSRSLECSLPLEANVGLPGHLIQCLHPPPAYVTYTAPVVRMLVKQDEQQKAAACCPAEMEPNREPPEAEFDEGSPVLSELSRGSSTPGAGKDSAGMSVAESRLPSPSVYNRVIFARKHALSVLPRGSLVCSSKKK
ncbi:CMT1A duplicated region transcript 4 protein homolog [Colius striatus]|uniref:CMT1A duplicated region transcript 4 protein homolog n=1 Tax=Colius striatus TaxID=57412 RepID=UPI002B1E4429|nr:CMT1A duplicated region transcript 4 protein homolog [Colius striatus]